MRTMRTVMSGEEGGYGGKEGLLHNRDVYSNTKKYVSDRQLNDRNTPKVYLFFFQFVSRNLVTHQ